MPGREKKDRNDKSTERLIKADINKAIDPNSLRMFEMLKDGDLIEKFFPNLNDPFFLAREKPLTYIEKILFFGKKGTEKLLNLKEKCGQTKSYFGPFILFSFQYFLISWKLASRKQKIHRPLGVKLDRFASTVFTKRIYQETFAQIISENREDHDEALFEKRIWKARWIKVRGWGIFWKAFWVESTSALLPKWLQKALFK